MDASLPASFRVALCGWLVITGGAAPGRADSFAIQQPSSNIFVLSAERAVFDGSGLRLESSTQSDLGGWSDASVFPTWTINVATTGHYRVEIDYSATTGSATDVIEFAAGSAKVDFHPISTGGWGTYRTAKIGEIDLNDSGHVDVTLKCVQKSGGDVMNVRQIRIVPAEDPGAPSDIVPVTVGTPGNPVTLTPDEAEIHGTAVTIEGDGNFGSWKSADTWFRWPVRLAPGRYHVEWLYSVDSANQGSDVQVTVGHAPPLKVQPASTDDWKNYQRAAVGDVTIAKDEPVDVVVTAVRLQGSFVMNLKEITLTPVK